MSCPSNSINGFLSFSSVPSTTPFQQTVGTNASPFFMAFAPRTTPITLINGTNNIQEDPQNTITYRGVQYTIESAQICKPSTGNYSIYGVQPLASINVANTGTLIFTFTTLNPDASHPKQLMLILPIYVGGNGYTSAYLNTAGYLKQLLYTETTTTAYPSLQELFKNQPSFAYMVCIPGNTVATNIMMYTFINGIQLTDREWYALRMKLPNEGTNLPYVSRSGLTIPFLPAKPPTDEAIVNQVTYYRLDIQPAAKVGYNTKQNLKTTEYQCQPFDQLKNLQTEPGGVKRVSLDQIIKTSDSAMVGFSFSFNDLAAVFWPIAGILLAFLCLGLYFFFSSGVEALPPKPAAVAATGATGATGAATATGAGAVVT